LYINYIGPTDLRIGNLVTDEVYSQDIIVKYISDKYINDGIIYRYIRPIGISRDLLLNVGFKEIYSNICSLKNGFTIKYDEIKNSWLEYDSFLEIQGFHHLQNIYFFKYNKELI